MRISGSTVLLTGASGGIGHAIAKAVADRGGRLTVSGRRGDVLDELTANYGGRTLSSTWRSQTTSNDWPTKPATSTS